MKRELKFRVFDNSNKKMSPVNSIWGFPDVENITIPFEDTVETLFNNFELMQSTGFVDKNGVEIYEGDIVNSGTGEILWCELEAMFKVKWHGEVFKRIRGQNDRYTLNGEPLFMSAHIAWEVIGNIHENPELLSRAINVCVYGKCGANKTIFPTLAKWLLTQNYL